MIGNYNSWKEWDAREYLSEYYLEVQPDEEIIANFLVEEFKKLDYSSNLLEFGCGPTIHHVLPAASRVKSVFMADYLPQNLQEVELWCKRQQDFFDWSHFTKHILELETNTKPTEEEIGEREDLLRSKIKGLSLCDGSKNRPMYPYKKEVKYPIVLSCYCADSATSNLPDWQNYMKNILSLVEPGGYFITTALRKCSGYRVGGKYYPSANISESDLKNVLRGLDFIPESINIEVERVPEHKKQGFGSIILATAQKDR